MKKKIASTEYEEAPWFSIRKRKNFRNIDLHHTVIPPWIYQIPSELWSQAGLGLLSTVVGDHTGIVSAVCFLGGRRRYLHRREKKINIIFTFFFVKTCVCICSIWTRFISTCKTPVTRLYMRFKFFQIFLLVKLLSQGCIWDLNFFKYFYL